MEESLFCADFVSDSVCYRSLIVTRVSFTFYVLGFTLHSITGESETHKKGFTLLVSSGAWIRTRSCLGVRLGGATLEDKMERRGAVNKRTGKI